MPAIRFRTTAACLAGTREIPPLARRFRARAESKAAEPKEQRAIDPANGRSVALAKFNSEWLVGPHGAAKQLDDGLLTVAGEIRMPLGNFPRRMTAIRLKSGKVAIWSAMSVSEPVLKRIQEMGEIAFLIVPGIGHRLDIIAWRRRFPDAKVLCSPGAKSAVEEAVTVD